MALRKLVPVLISLVILAAGIAVIVGGRDEALLAQASVESSCIVKESGVRVSKNHRRPWVLVVHELDGKRHERTDIGVEQSESEAEAAIAAFQAGAKVRCRYVEGRPDLVAVLEARQDGNTGIIVGACIALFGLVALIINLLRLRRPASAPQTG